jgi:putative salt-induced outer membrane protein YdiY
MNVKRAALLLSLFSAASLHADQVTMKNGDRLSGTVQKSDGKVLVLKSEFAGLVTIPWDAVTSLESSAPLTVGLAEGKNVVGTVQASGGQLTVKSADGATASAPLASVRLLRSKEEQAAYDAETARYAHPGLADLWAGFVDFGYAHASGNASTSSLSVTSNASRATKNDKIGVYFTSLYASNDTTGRSLVTANAIRGGLKYERNVSPKLFVFALSDFEYDQFQNLDLRFSPALGFGYHAVKTDRTTFDLLGGGALNREYFSNKLHRSSGEALLSDELTYKLNSITQIRQKLAFFPNLTRTGDFRINFDTSAVTALKKWLGWQVTFSDRYLSNPLTGRKKNDVLFTTGIRLTFAR